jgi:hypothetical protein
MMMVTVIMIMMDDGVGGETLHAPEEIAEAVAKVLPVSLCFLSWNCWKG